MKIEKRINSLVVPEITQAYWQLVVVDSQNCPPGLYAIESLRSILHKDLVNYYNLTKEQAKEITDNLHRFERTFDEKGAMFQFHKALESLREKYFKAAR